MRSKWWKVYFWIFVIGSIIGTFTAQPTSALEIAISLVFTSLYVFALYSYSFSKSFFPRCVWILLFWSNMAILLFQSFYFINYDSFLAEFTKQGIKEFAPKPDIIDIGLNILFSIPLYIALFNLGYPMQGQKKLKSNGTLLWWKIYFWVILLILIAGAAIPFFEPSYKPTTYDILSYGEMIIIQLGMYAYVFKKRILNTKAWLILFWVIIVDAVLYGMYSAFPSLQSNPIFLTVFKSGFPTTKFSEFVIISILYIPACYALYKLASATSKKETLQKGHD